MACLPSVQGSVAYLPVVGPAPLRFESTAANARPLAWKSLRLTLWPPAETALAARNASSPTNVSPQVVAKSVSSSPTNRSNLVTLPADYATANTNGTSEPEVMMLPERPGDGSDPVSVQKLIEYFVPGTDGKNQGGKIIFMPGDIGFTPPTPKISTENRATYKSQ